MAVKQILNVLDLIEFFARTKKPASLAEIQSQFGWPRSSAYNILNTLIERGYVYEADRPGGYFPTPMLARMGEAIVSADCLNERLAELLVDLSEMTGETAILAGPAGRYFLCLDLRESSAAIRYSSHVGRRIPIHASASGRALLSLYSAAERAGVLGRIVYEAGTNAPMNRSEVEAEIASSLQRGWFQSINEYNADLAAISLPVVVDDRRLAFVVAGPVFRLGDKCADVAGILRHLIGRYELNDGAGGSKPTQEVAPVFVEPGS